MIQIPNREVELIVTIATEHGQTHRATVIAGWIMRIRRIGCARFQAQLQSDDVIAAATAEDHVERSSRHDARLDQPQQAIVARVPLDV